MTAGDSGIVLFMGMVRRGEFESLERRSLPLGVLVDTNNKQRLADVSKFVFVERFDFSRPLADLVEAVRAIHQRFGIACLYNVIELYVAQTAHVAAELGLHGIPPEAARLCLDKHLMRQRFQDRIGPGASARFQMVRSEGELAEQANRFGYPVFLQPSNVSASMWATRNETFHALVENYHAMKEEVPKYYSRLGQTSKVLEVVLAEYLEGPNSSVDCLVDGSGDVYTTPLVDVLTGRDIGIDDYHHFARLLPSTASGDDQEELVHLARVGVRALDMRSAAAHVEFIGRRLGEIGARPGGNRPRILELAYGIDELHAYYQVLRGGLPRVDGDRRCAAAIVTPFPPKSGTLRQIRHLGELSKLPGYLYHEVRMSLGQPVGLAKGGFRAPLYVELQSAEADVVRRSVDEIAAWSDLYEVE